MRTLHRLLILPVLVLAVNACAHHHRDSGSAEPYAASTLHIDNHHWLDVDIFVLHEGQRSRLGTVTAASSKDFIFPRALLGAQGEIRLIADPIGAPGALTTDLIVVRPGSQVTWTLESNLQRSSLAIY